MQTVNIFLNFGIYTKEKNLKIPLDQGWICCFCETWDTEMPADQPLALAKPCFKLQQLYCFNFH